MTSEDVCCSIRNVKFNIPCEAKIIAIIIITIIIISITIIIVIIITIIH